MFGKSVLPNTYLCSINVRIADYSDKSYRYGNSIYRIDFYLNKSDAERLAQTVNELYRIGSENK